MVQHPGSVCRQGLAPHAGEVAEWQIETVQSVADIEHVIGIVTAAATATAGFSEKETLRLRLALEEALVNAHKHGHQGDWTKPITLRYHVNENGVAAEVEDQGAGFDPAQVKYAECYLGDAYVPGLFPMHCLMNSIWPAWP